VQRRGGKGILTLNRTEKTGDVVALMEVLPEDEIMLITKGGVIIRSPVSQVRVTGRNAQGVHLVHLDEGDLVTAVARVVPDDDKGEEEVEAGVAGDSGGTDGDGPEQGDLLGGAE
jgi:DNA gyrase subunit A